MDKAKPSIRLMQTGDIDAVVAIHKSQFPAARSTQLGSPFIRKMYRWFIAHQARLALVAEEQSLVMGFVVGSIGGYGRNIFRYALPQIVLGVLLHPGMIFRRETYGLWHSFLRGLFPREPGKTETPQPDQKPIQINAALSSIAVDQNYQGKGVGKALMDRFEANARALGAQTTSLTVEKDNHAAIHLYRSCGWMIDKEHQHSVHLTKSLATSACQSNDPNG